MSLMSLRRSFVSALVTMATLTGLGLAAALPAAAQETLFGLNTNNQLFRFTSTTPGSFTSLAGVADTTTTVTGLGGLNLASIDFRPSNGLLYGLATDGTTFRLYTIDTTTGIASLNATLTASTGGTNPTATPFAFAASNFIDFNPQGDALRIVNSSGGNYRISTANLNAGNGITFTDIALSLTGISGIAYNNNVAGAASTTLFDVSGATDTLYQQNPPNNGTLVAVGATGVDTASFGDLDISGATGIAYYGGPLASSGQSQLFTVNTLTGAFTTVGTFAAGVGQVRGIAAPVGIGSAAAPEPGSVALLGIGLLGLTGGVLRRRRKTA